MCTAVKNKKTEVLLLVFSALDKNLNWGGGGFLSLSCLALFFQILGVLVFLMDMATVPALAL